MNEGSRKAIVAALLANLGLAVAKFVAFAFTGASAMLAEGVHSIADTGNQGLLFLGGVRSRREATTHHPFGYGRERYFWSFIVALVLFSMGSMFAIYEGVLKWGRPEPLEQPAWAVSVLLVGIALESFSLRTAARESRAAKGERSWWAFIRHARAPELPVVLLEDLGALLGLFIALVGVGVATATGDGRFDGGASIAIGLLLGVIALLLAGEMKSLLVGESADRETRAALEEVLGAHPDVARLIHLRTQHLGPDDLLVAAKIQFEAGLDSAAVARVIDEVEDRLRRAVPIARFVYIEPDVHRGPGEASG